MAIRLDRKHMLRALGRRPTAHWGAVLSEARRVIESEAVCITKDWVIIEPGPLTKATNLMHTLPYGGRWVIQERKELWREFGKAVESGLGRTV